MKGRFSLNVYQPSPRSPMYLTFGNLRGDEVEQFGFNIDESLTEQRRNEIGRVVAHDVIEHSVKHRTAKHVPVEEELRALGAIRFVRPTVDIEYDICDTLRNLRRRLMPVPIRLQTKDVEITAEEVFDYIHPDALDASPEDAVFKKNGGREQLAEVVAQYMNWGHAIKSRQFDGNRSRADRAFRMVQDGVSEALRMFSYEDYAASGISMYFDTDLNIFRHRFRRQWKD